MSLEVYLTAQEAAQYLRSSTSTLAKFRVYGGGPTFCRLDRAIRYRRSDLDEFMAHGRVRSTSAVRDLRATMTEYAADIHEIKVSGKRRHINRNHRANSTRHPFSTRARPMAAARWLFPVPVGPNNKRLAPFSIQLSPEVSAII